MAFALSSSSLTALSIVSASISLLISGLFALLYTRHARARTFSSRIMFNLAIADLGLSLSYFFVGEGLCLLQSICQQFFSLASWSWMAVLAVHTMLVCDSSTSSAAFRFSRVYMYMAWIAPAFLTFIPLASTAMGPTDLWCWIGPQYAGHRYFGLYFPSFVAYLIIAYSYISAIIHLKSIPLRTRTAGNQPASRDLDKQSAAAVADWILYLIVLALVRLPPLVHRSAEFFSEADAIMLLLHAMLAPLQPAVNSLLMWNKNRAIRRILIIQRKNVPNIAARLLSFGHEENDFDPPFIPLKDAPSLRILSVPAELDEPIGRPLSPTPPQIYDPRSNHLPLSYSVFTGTWNCGNKRPSLESLNDWIPANEYDVYAIGTQECHYYFDEKQKTLTGRMLHSRAHSGAHWRETVMSLLGNNYTLVEYVSLHHIRLIVAVRTSLIRRISNVTSHSEGAGLMKLHGNKGSVSITFSLDDLSFAFVSSHLAAHANQFHSRAEDFVQSLFGCFLNANIGSFNAVFILGDLNYRLTASKHEIVDWLVEKRYDILKESDELLALMHSNRLFYALKEGELMFPPTYKYLVPKRSIKRTLVVGDALTMSVKGEYDVIDIEHDEPEVRRPHYDEQHETVASRGHNDESLNQPEEYQSVADARLRKTQQKYTLKRSPAWCDRILYQSASHVTIKQHEYTAIKTVKSSDHKPVRAVFSVGFTMPGLRRFKRITDQVQVDDDDDMLSTGASHRSRSLERAKKLSRFDPILDYYRHIALHSYPSIHQSSSHLAEMELVFTHIELYDCVTPYSFPLVYPYLTISHTINQTSLVYQSQVAVRVNDRIHVPLRPHAPSLMLTNAAILAVSPTVSLPMTPSMNAQNDLGDQSNTPSLPASLLHSRSNSIDMTGGQLDERRVLQSRAFDTRLGASRDPIHYDDDDTDFQMSARIDQLLSGNQLSSSSLPEIVVADRNSSSELQPLSSPYRTQHPSVHPSPRRWDASEYSSADDSERESADFSINSMSSLNDSEESDVPSRQRRLNYQQVNRPANQRRPPPNHPPAPFVPPLPRVPLSFPALLPSPSNATSMVCSWPAVQLPVVPIHIQSGQSVNSPPALLSVSRASVAISVSDRAWLGDSSEFVGVANVELHLLMKGGESSFMVPVTWATRFNGYIRGRGFVRVKSSQRPVNIVS